MSESRMNLVRKIEQSIPAEEVINLLTNHLEALRVVRVPFQPGLEETIRANFSHDPTLTVIYLGTSVLIADKEYLMYACIHRCLLEAVLPLAAPELSPAEKFLNTVVRGIDPVVFQQQFLRIVATALIVIQENRKVSLNGQEMPWSECWELVRKLPGGYEQ